MSRKCKLQREKYHLRGKKIEYDLWRNFPACSSSLLLAQYLLSFFVIYLDFVLVTLSSFCLCHLSCSFLLCLALPRNFSVTGVMSLFLSLYLVYILETLSVSVLGTVACPYSCHFNPSLLFSLFLLQSLLISTVFFSILEVFFVSVLVSLFFSFISTLSLSL